MYGDTLILNTDMMPMCVMPLSTMMWQDAIRSMWLDSTSVVEFYDDWVVRSPTTEMFVPAVMMTKEYVKVDHRVGFSPENVFLRDNYRCQYCLNQFPEKKLTLDHVVPRTYGGPTTWENITTACSPCNNKRGHNTKIQPVRMPHRPSYYEMVGIRRSHPIIVPHESWQVYLQWDNVIVRKPRRSGDQLPMMRAA